MIQTNPKNELTLEIDALSYGPYGIGRVEGKAVMIPKTAPGDTVVARITEARERYAVGELVRVVDASSLRQTPPCPYVAECGGCPWQHLRHEAQLQAKQKSVEDALRRIGKLETFELRPIIASPLSYHYRRRVRLQRNASKRLGFFRSFSHDLVEIHRCHIADDHLNQVIEPLRRWSDELNSDIEDLEVVTGDEPDQLVVIGQSAGKFDSRDSSICEGLVKRHDLINGLILRGPGWRRTWGETLISVLPEDGVRLKVDGDVFTQVNREGNRKLLNELLAAADFNRDDRVLELYSGAGNFTLSIAKRAGDIVAVEGYRAAIESGKRSAQFHGIANIHWIGSPIAAALAQLKKTRQRFSKIVLDPPRTGAKGIERDL
ncbi:MAG: 23S rRNA (uracil(1939)-C(5))-methyltransferase RlmD, partial [Deltaproteobacteria bacterium]|nr:23S rRNA (uracil(1939)-C(5))-methyltransferase RlmD [Deltaproteobacteria bacterium]